MEIGKSCPATPEVTAFSIQTTLPAFEIREHRSSDELPPVPPNTAHQSGQSSAMHSQLHTPSCEDEDRPLELNANLFLNRPRSTQLTHPPVLLGDRPEVSTPIRRSSMPASPTIPRRLSSLGEEELRFRSHRDSVEITQGMLKRQELEGKISQHLADAHRDSFILTKSKYESRYPKANLPTTKSWNRFGGLSPIMDSSPPNSNTWTAKSLNVEPSPERSPRHVAKRFQFLDVHLDEHKDCPIYEAERPRWFEANYRK